jgi:ferredoxin-nitrite reductase
MADEERRFREDFLKLEDASHKYDADELDAKGFKAVSTSFGGYLQRGDLQMLRIRVPGGRLSVEHARAVVECCRYYGLEQLKITTGEALQIHDLDSHAARRLVLRLLDAGIVTFGAGGDNPNNVSAPPLTGLSNESRFDVLPYALATEECYLHHVGVSPLPRKFKVGFADSAEDETHVTMKDLGFMANPDGTFQVWIAGGMGIKPRMGLMAAESVAPTQVVYHALGMLELFSERGNRTLRAKSRSRFLQESMGADQLLEEYRARVAALEEAGGLDVPLAPSFPPIQKAGDGGAAPHDWRVVAQRQPGLFAVRYHPMGGYLSVGALQNLVALAEPWDCVEFRLTPHGGLYVVNLSSAEAWKVLEATLDGARTPFEASSTCVGHRRCDIGVADSQELMRECVAAVREAGLSARALPCMGVSGCMSSCGDSPIAALGWRGMRRKVEGEMCDAFALSIGGSCAQGCERIAPEECTMLASTFPPSWWSWGARWMPLAWTSTSGSRVTPTSCEPWLPRTPCPRRSRLPGRWCPGEGHLE